MTDTIRNPAEQAAEEALNNMYACIDKKKSFRLEAGAGAGKTYSLIKALKYLIGHQGGDLIRKHQQVACITFTNVACGEIESRTDRHPAIYSSTIHSFCWSIIKDFQPYLRKELPNIENWVERLKEVGGIGTRSVGYDELGHRKVEDSHVSIHHDDVLTLTIKLMEHEKFRNLLAMHYPIIFIDEYQDTDKEFAESLKKHFIETGEGPLIGFFGDHWQKIYGSGCGKIEHPALEIIGKKANFRSVPVIVSALNRMRPELPQEVKDPNAKGYVALYHTNERMEKRRTGQHWDGDLPPDIAHGCLEALIKQLTAEEWDFSPDVTKILMLTHKVLAAKQGYCNIANVFSYADSYIKKEDIHIAFLVDIVEPVFIAYGNRHFGEMFSVLGNRTLAIRSHSDKVAWSKDMDRLLVLRDTSTIGEVLDHLQKSKRPRLPEAVERRAHELEQQGQVPKADESSSITRLRELSGISYKEVSALARFINEQTPFVTKHGVKGAEFENVLVVFGRGWNHYNFNQFLEWAGNPATIPSDKIEAFERNRNLFYVVCSRPKKRLAMLFTQKLSDKALATLAGWFGSKAINSLHC